MGMATQWKTGPVGRTGLDYLALETVARSLRIEYPLSPETFSDLRYMEAEALMVWSDKSG